MKDKKLGFNPDLQPAQNEFSSAEQIDSTREEISSIGQAVAQESITEAPVETNPVQEAISVEQPAVVDEATTLENEEKVSRLNSLLSSNNLGTLGGINETASALGLENQK